MEYMSIQDFVVWFLVVWVLLLLLARQAKLSKYGIFVGPFIAIIRTEKMNTFLTWVGRRFQRLISFTGRVAVVFSYLLLGVSLVGFAVNSYLLLFASTGGFGVVPIIPGVTITLRQFLFFLVPLSIAIIVHEFSHGIMAVAEKVKVASTGLLLIGVIVGGFVEPEREEFEASSPESKKRIIAAGILANVLVALLVIPLIFGNGVFASLLYDQGNGVFVVAVRSGSAADQAGIKEGDVITGVVFLNGTAIDTTNVSSLVWVLSSIPPGETVLIQTTRQTLAVNSPDYPERPVLGGGGRFGLSLYPYYEPKYGFLSPWIPYVIDSELMLLLNFNIMLALLNVMPLWITDGDKIMQIVLQGKRHERVALNGIRLVSLGLLGISMVLSVF